MSKQNLDKSFFDAPFEVKSAAIRSTYGVGVSFTEYKRLVLTYPEWFDEDEVKHIQKLKDEEINNTDNTNNKSTEL
jgi:hypothetical protein